MSARPSIDAYLMSIAEEVAARSTCSDRHRTGAVASVGGRIIMTGYNGVPSGVPHCDDTYHVRLEDGKHAFLLHAEENIVAQAARLNIRLSGAVVHCTHAPCPHCTAIMVQAGICEVTYRYNRLQGLENKYTRALMRQVGARLYYLSPSDEKRRLT